MANYNGSLEAVDYHIRSVRYDMVQESQMPHQVAYDVVATPIRPKKLEPCQRCFYTIMANYNVSLEAVDCDIHSVRYGMIWCLREVLAAVSDVLNRSPTTLWRRRYDQKELEPRKRCFHTIMANYNVSLEAVVCDIYSVRYDMAVK